MTEVTLDSIYGRLEQIIEMVQNNPDSSCVSRETINISVCNQCKVNDLCDSIYKSQCVVERMLEEVE